MCHDPGIHHSKHLCRATVPLGRRCSLPHWIGGPSQGLQETPSNGTQPTEPLLDSLTKPRLTRNFPRSSLCSKKEFVNVLVYEDKIRECFVHELPLPSSSAPTSAASPPPPRCLLQNLLSHWILHLERLFLTCLFFLIFIGFHGGCIFYPLTL